MPITKTGPLPYLSDVADALNPNDGDALIWSESAQQWIAAPLSVSGGGEFVQKSGDEMSGGLTITTDLYPGLIVRREDGDEVLAINPSGQTSVQGSFVVGDGASKFPLKVDAATETVELNRLTKVGALTPSSGYVLTWTGTEYLARPTAVTTRRSALNFVIDGGGAAITTGIKGDLKIAQDGNLLEWSVLADQVGSVTIDIWKDGYFAYPPTVADTMFSGVSKPNLFNAIKNASILPNTFQVYRDDVLRFNVDSASTIQRLTLELVIQEVVPALAAAAPAGGSLAHPEFTYTIFPLSPSQYQIMARDGTIVGTFSDGTGPPVSSGLLQCFTATVDHGVSWYLDGAEFSFPEDPAGDADHWAVSGYQGLRWEGRGIDSTVLANWRDDTQPGYDTNKDTEPLSFTRCNDVVLRNLEIVAGGNVDANNSSDTIDQDGCSFALIEHVKVRRSRARGIVEDGGDTGAVSQGAMIQQCQIYGTPHPPLVSTGNGVGTMPLQEYRYCLTWVDTLFGETVPGDYTAFTAFSAAKPIRLQFERGPMYRGSKGVTARNLYRWSAAQPVYRLVTTFDNTVVEYLDNATDASIAGGAAPPTVGPALIPKEGVKLLGSRRHTVAENYIYGTGSHNIQAVRKGSDAASNKQSNAHDIGENFLGYPGLGTALAAASCVFVGGGDRVKVHDNDMRNPGNAANRGYGIYVQNQEGATTVGTQLDGNTIIDDRDANHPHGAAGMLHGIRQYVAGAAAPPTETAWGFNRISGSSSTAINDGGITSHTPAEVGHTHAGIDANLAWPRTVAGQYYSPASFVAWTSAADFTMVPNHVYGGSVFFVDPTTIDDLELEIRTLPTVGSVMRLLIFAADDTNGFWSTNLYESADISISTTGFKVVNPNLALEAQHRYFFAVVSNTDAAIRVVQPTSATLGFSTPAVTPGKLNALDKAIGTAWQSGAVGPGPAAPSLTNNVPLIFGRAST